MIVQIYAFIRITNYINILAMMMREKILQIPMELRKDIVEELAQAGTVKETFGHGPLPTNLSRFLTVTDSWSLECHFFPHL